MIEYFKQLIDKFASPRLNAFLALLSSLVLAFCVLYLVILIPFIDKSLIKELGMVSIPLAGLSAYTYKKAKEKDNKN